MEDTSKLCFRMIFLLQWQKLMHEIMGNADDPEKSANKIIIKNH